MKTKNLLSFYMIVSGILVVLCSIYLGFLSNFGFENNENGNIITILLLTGFANIILGALTPFGVWEE